MMKALHTSVVSVDVVSRPQGPAPAATPTIANSPTSSASSPRAASSSRNVANADNDVWSPVVATGGNRSQNGQAQKPRKQAKTFAVGCDRLPQRAHGKEVVSGSSPSEGSAKAPHGGAFVFTSTCRFSRVRWVWSRLRSFRVGEGHACAGRSSWCQGSLP